MNYNNFDARLSRGTASRKRKNQAPSGALGGNGQASKREGHTGRRMLGGARRAAEKHLAILGIFAAGICAANAQTYTIDLEMPTMDKWIYPFAGNGGATRASGPTFGAIGSVGFDDRDGQYFARFDTTGTVPSGLGANCYQIISATFTLSIAVGGAVVFDPTYDSISTYGPGGEQINGDDPGRPIELFGAGYRNGFTSGSIAETTAFGAPGEGTRNIFATDFQLGASLSGANRDVSNNVAQGFDPLPFAIGQIAPGDLQGGTAVADTDVVFMLNLTNPDVVRYLQLSLDEGHVSFLATSLHQAAQGGPTVYPDFYTKENLLDGLPGRLDVQVQVVPEPASAGLLIIGAGCLAIRRRYRA